MGEESNKKEREDNECLPEAMAKVNSRVIGKEYEKEQQQYQQQYVYIPIPIVHTYIHTHAVHIPRI